MSFKLYNLKKNCVKIMFGLHNLKIKKKNYRLYNLKVNDSWKDKFFLDCTISAKISCII